MTHLAFQYAARAGGLVAEAIAGVTGGRFSHVELWLNGPRDRAECYSSREPVGTGFATIDLSDDSLWVTVPLVLSGEQETALYWFCRGSTGRPYDFMGIAGIAMDTRAHSGFARFCSEACCEALQVIGGWWQGIQPWHVAPSGFEGHGDRHGLYELATAAAGAKA